MDLSLFLDLWLAYEGLDLDLEGGLFCLCNPRMLQMEDVCAVGMIIMAAIKPH